MRLDDDGGSSAQQSPTVAIGAAEAQLAWRDNRLSANGDIQSRKIETLATLTDHFALSYDGLNRLTSVSGPVAESFSLDGPSNITSRTGPTQSDSYDQSNRLTSDGTLSYTWSDADRLTNRGADTFGYDPLDRMTSSTVAGASRTYAYNGDGLLQSRTGSGAATLLWDPNTSPSRLLKQGSDAVVYGLGPLYAVKNDGTILAFARDGSKNVRAEVDDSGVVTAAFRYLSYGQLVQATTIGPNYFGFASQLVDPSGLYYMRARWYDAAAARFLVHDPKSGDPGSPGTLNEYLYALADPVAMSDTSGMMAVDLNDGACTAACDETGTTPGGGISVISPRGSLSLGLITSFTVEAGNGTMMGAATASEGQMLLSTANDLRPLDPTGSGFTSYGAYGAVGPVVAGTPAQQGMPSRTGGAYIGAGSGIFLSNAPSAGRLSGPFEQMSLNIGLIPTFLPMVPSVTFAWSGNPLQGGTWIATVTMGPGIGAAFTKMTTMTMVH